MPSHRREIEAHSQQVERLIAELLARPFIRENVFHSVRFVDSTVEKEVCDVLLVHRDECIVFSVKAQDVPRDLIQTNDWLKKNAAKAVKQLGGAYRTLREKRIWCEHSTLGRKAFEPAAVRAVHGIAVLESDFATTVDIDRSYMEKLAGVAPVTLMTVLDFANVGRFLRTWRDLRSYLDARHAALRDPDRRAVGSERPLFTYYTNNGDSLAGCGGIADASVATASQTDALSPRTREWALASILEDLIAHIAVATEVDLPIDDEALGEPLVPIAVGRTVLRDDLCDLTIQERAAIGEQIGVLSGRAAQEQGTDPFYGAVRFDRTPDKVYLVIVGWKVSPSDMAMLALDATIAACTFYRRSVGVALAVNQVANDTVRFSLARLENVQASAEMEQRGIELFGHVRPRQVIEAR